MADKPNTPYRFDTSFDSVNPADFLDVQAAAPAPDYALNPSKETLKDARFLADLREFYKTRDGKEFSSDEEALSHFWSDRTWRNMNTVSQARDLTDTLTMSDRQKELLGRIETVHKHLPNFYEDGGRGLEGLAQNAAAAILDPINLVGFGAAKGVAMGTLKAGGSAAKAALAAGRAGAVAEGATEAGVSAVQSVLEQARDTKIGLDDGVSIGQTAVDAIAGGLLGGLLGGTIGGGKGIYDYLSAKKALGSWPETRVQMMQRIAEGGLPTEQAQALEAQMRDMDTAFVNQGLGSEEVLLAPSRDFIRNREAEKKLAANPEPGLPMDGGSSGDNSAQYDARKTRVTNSLNFLGTEIDALLAKEAKAQASGGTLDADEVSELQALVTRRTVMDRLANFDAEMAKLEGKKAELDGQPGEQAAQQRAEIDMEQRRLRALYNQMTAAAERGQSDLDEFVEGIQPSLFEAAPATRTATTPEAKAAEGGIELNPPAQTLDQPDLFLGSRVQPGTANAAPVEAAPVESAQPAPELDFSQGDIFAPQLREARGVNGPSGGITVLTQAGIPDADAKLLVRQARQGKKGKEAEAAMQNAVIEAVTGRQLDDVLERIAQVYGDEAVTNEGLIGELLKKHPNGARLFDAYKANVEAMRVADDDMAEVDTFIADFLKKVGEVQGSAAPGDRPYPKADHLFARDAVQRVSGRAKKAMPDITKDELTRLEREVDRAALAFSRQMIPSDPKAKLKLLDQFIDERVAALKEARGKRAGDTGILRPAGTAPSKAGADTPDADNPAALKSAARMPNPASMGGIPAILKRWGNIGGVSQTVSKADIGALGEIKARAQLKGWKTPQKFVADRAMTTADGVEIKKGAEVWYDPTRDKVYSRLETTSLAPSGKGAPTDAGTAKVLDAMAAVTQPKAEAPAAPAADKKAARKAKKAEAAPAVDIASVVEAAMRAAGADDVAIQAAVAAIRATQAATPAKAVDVAPAQAATPAASTPEPKVEAPAAPAADLPPNPSVPEGRRLAIRNKESGKVRVLSQTQAASGAHWSVLVGKSDASKWEIGHVNDRIRTDGPAARDDFRLNGEAAPAQPKAATIEEVVRTSTKTTPRQEAAVQAKLPTMDEIGEQAIEIVAEHPTHGRIVEKTTVRKGYALLQDLYNKVPPNLSGLDGNLSLIRALEAQLPKVKLPSQTASAAREQLLAIMGKYDADTAIAAVDFLRRTGLTGEAPIIREMNGGYNTSGGYAPGSNNANWQGLGPNEIGIRTQHNPESPFAKGEGTTAPISTLHHEFAHWGFFNVLTPEDRIAFMESLRKHAGPDGRFTFEGFTANLARQGFVDDAYAAKPAELFAFQFQQFVASGGKVPGDRSLFERIIRTLVAVVDRFFNKKLVDADLEPFFAKLLPEPVADAWLRGMGADPKTADGKAVFRTMQTLDAKRVEFEQVLNGYNTQAILTRSAAFLRDINAMAADLGDALSDDVRKRMNDLAADIKGMKPVAVDPRAAEAAKRLAGRSVEVPDRLSRAFAADPESVVTHGDVVETDAGKVTVTNENARALAGEGYTVVTRDVMDALLARTAQPSGNDVFTAVRIGNDVADLIQTMKQGLKDRFKSVENERPRRVENPLDLFKLPDGAEDKAPHLMRRYGDMNDVLAKLDDLEVSEDIYAVQTLVDIARTFDGIVGTYVVKEGKSYRVGGLRTLAKTNRPLANRAAGNVRRAYDLFTDASPDWHPGKDDNLSAMMTVQTMTPEQKAEFGKLIEDFRHDAIDVQDTVASMWRKVNAVNASGSERSPIARLHAKRAQAAKKAERAVKQAHAVTKTTKGEAQPKRQTAAKADPAKASAPQSMTDDQLVDELLSVSAKSERGRQLSVEIVRRQNTIPGFDPDTLRKPVPTEFFFLKGGELKARLEAAKQTGDKATADAIRGEVVRRALKSEERVRLAAATTKQVNAAIQKEIADNMGVPVLDGVPRNANARVREVLTKFTHRDPQKQTTLRTMLYRALNVAGLGSPDTMTVGAIYRMAGLEVPGHLSPEDAFLDLRDPAFNAVRKHMRTMIGSFVDGGQHPKATMAGLVEFLTRTPLYRDQDVAAMSTAYRAADDKFADALRSSGLPESVQAQAWFAHHATEFLAGDVGKTQAFLGRADLPPATLAHLRSLLTRTTDSASYVLNGLMANDTMRSTFKAVTDYGDMLGNAGRTPAKATAVSPLRAAIESVFTDPVMREMSETREARIKAFTMGDTKPWYHGTPNGKWSDDPNAIMLHSETGYYGPGIYLTRREDAGRLYAEAPTPAAADRMVKTAGLSGDDASYARALLAHIATEYHVAQQHIADAKAIMAKADKTPEDFAEVERIKGLLDEQDAYIDAMHDELGGLGVKMEARVLPMYARITKALDLRRDKVFSAEAPEVRAIVDALAERGYVAPDTATKLARKGPLGFRLDMTKGSGQHALYDSLIQAIAERGHQTDEAQFLLTETLRDLGYDAILTHHANSLDGRRGSLHETAVLMGDGPSGDASTFGAYQVKHENASFFDPMEAGIYAEPMDGTRPVAALAQAASSTSGGIDNTRASLILTEAAERAGAGPEVADLLRFIPRMTGEKTEPQQFARALETARKFNPANLIRENSEKLREFGANWMADQIKPLDGSSMFEQHSEVLGRKLMPLLEVLNRLPDATSGMKRWLQRSKPWGDIPQPASHKRVVQFLRGEEVRLSDAERAVGERIKRAFRAELDAMRKAGIEVGDVGENYFPQIHNSEAIQRDRAKARAAYAAYFKAEARKMRGEVLSEDQALLKADEWIDRILMDDGVYTAPKAERRSARSDHTDYQRMMRLHERDASGKLMFANEIKLLDDFMEDNLEAVLAKYFDGTTRRIQFEEKFGVNNHVFHDYVHVAQFGVEGAIDLMSTDRVLRMSRQTMTEDGGVETVNRQLVKMRSLDPARAGEAVRAAYSRLGAGDLEGAKKALMDAAPPQPGNDLRTWEKRVDAVIYGLRDFPEAGEPGGGLKASQVDFMDGTFRSAQRKPIGSGAFFDSARKASRWLRNFNSVTLLGFTTITSFTDVMLPLIRSGNFTAWAKGLGKWATDKEYREAMRTTGVALENFVHDRLHMLYGGEGGRFTQAFFNANMLTPWTNVMREVAGSVAIQAFRAEQKRALAAGRQSRAYRLARQRLAHYGIEHFLDDSAARRLDDPALLDVETGDYALRQAVVKFSNETIFAPNPNDVPLWAQTPLGQVMFQLKSYPMMMHRFVWGKEGIIDRAKQGDLKPMALMLTIGTGWAMGTNAIKDIVQARGGEDERSAEVRERSFNKLAEQFGFKPELHGDADAFLGWYAEGFLLMGGLGLVADMLYQTTQQVDNGAWGFQRAMSTVFGPSVGVASGAFNVLGGAHHALTGDDGSTYRERQAIREIATRVPVLGGQREFREGLVDNIAGEKVEKGGSSGGFSGGFNGGFKGGFDK